MLLFPRSSPLNPSAASDLSTYSTASLISNEEQFEDYGEGDDVDFTPSSPCPDDESRTNAYSDLGSSVSSRFFSCIMLLAIMSLLAVMVEYKLIKEIINSILPFSWNTGRKMHAKFTAVSFGID